MSRALEAPLEDNEVLVGNKEAQRKKEKTEEGKMERRKGGGEGEREGGKEGESDGSNLLWFGNRHKGKVRRQKDGHKLLTAQITPGRQPGRVLWILVSIPSEKCEDFFPLRIS